VPRPDIILWLALVLAAALAIRARLGRGGPRATAYAAPPARLPSPAPAPLLPNLFDHEALPPARPYDHEEEGL